MRRIGLLHTAESHVAVMNAAAERLASARMTLDHLVRRDLLLAAEAAGGVDEHVAAEILAAISTLLDRNDVVQITCSSLGPMADGRQVQRIDAALAEQATKGRGSVTVLCTSPTTLVPTTELFAQAAQRNGASVTVRVIEGAWALFQSGDVDVYLERIAEAADLAVVEGADVVALAQLSMVGAVDLMSSDTARVMTCPDVGLRSVLIY